MTDDDPIAGCRGAVAGLVVMTAVCMVVCVVALCVVVWGG